MEIQLAGNTIEQAIIHNSLVNGEGLRTTIFCSGCRIRCKGCHNQETWDFDYGKAVDIDEIINAIKEDMPIIKGVTFSGGDPMDEKNAKGFAELAKKIKEELKLNIWCYTGQIYEEIIEEGNKDKLKLLQYIDVLVDGPFMEDLKENAPKYVGSSNQRIIPIKKSNMNLKGQMQFFC